MTDKKRGGYGSSSTPASKLVAPPRGPAPGARPKGQARPKRSTGRGSPTSFVPIPDAELRPTDTYLKIGRWLDRHHPKRKGVHRWITDTTRASAPAGGPVLCRIVWCWDCGSERSEAPTVCTHEARNRHEYTFAHNRRCAS